MSDQTVVDLQRDIDDCEKCRFMGNNPYGDPRCIYCTHRQNALQRMRKLESLVQYWRDKAHEQQRELLSARP